MTLPEVIVYLLSSSGYVRQEFKCFLNRNVVYLNCGKIECYNSACH